MQCCRCELGVGTHACGRFIWCKPTSLVSHCLYWYFYICYFLHFMYTSITIIPSLYHISCISHITYTSIQKILLIRGTRTFFLLSLGIAPFTYISSPPFTVYSIRLDRGRGLASLAVGYIWANFLHEFGGVGTPIPVRNKDMTP